MKAKTRRRLLTGATILSLILFLGIAAIWVKTFPRGPVGLFGGDDLVYELISIPRVNPMYGLIFYRGDFIVYVRSHRSFQLDPSSRGDYDHRFAGFIVTRDIQMNFRQWVFEGPTWIVLLLLAILPAAYVVHMKRRIPAGCCAICGYNLTGNTSGTCPECGSKIPQIQTDPLPAPHHSSQ